jgi:hypothetical protein
MEWSGADSWRAAEEVEWNVVGSIAGSVKASGLLSFVKVKGAGHMVRDKILNEGEFRK